MYWPPCNLNESTMVGSAGVFSGADLTAQQTRFDDLLDALLTRTIPMYLFHSTPEIGPYLVTSLSVSGLLATQRSRIR